MSIFYDQPRTIHQAELPPGVASVPGVITSTTTWSSSPAHVPGLSNTVSAPTGAGSPVSAASVGGVPDSSVADRSARAGLVTVSAVVPSGGTTAGGTACTVYGAHFSGATGCTFGGVAGTAFSVVDDSHIDVTTPAHAAGAVDVVVVDPAGEGALTGGFSYQ
jgi:hypothetical protein